MHGAVFARLGLVGLPQRAEVDAGRARACERCRADRRARGETRRRRGAGSRARA